MKVKVKKSFFYKSYEGTANTEINIENKNDIDTLAKKGVIEVPKVTENVKDRN